MEREREREREREGEDKSNKSKEIIIERWVGGVQRERDGGWERNISLEIGEKIRELGGVI